MIQRKNGYSLVLIILMSTFILALLAGAMRVVTQSYIYSQEEYYYKLAQEAGEAGTAYANACLDANGAEQSWSSAPGGIGPLHPETNCKGAVTFPGNRYVFENSKLRTTFEVGDLEASTKRAALSAATAQISSVGRVEITNGSGVVLKTYVAVVKKSVTWPADIDATRTVSGTNRTCAILSNNVWCWGKNDMGQLGDGTTHSSNIPVKVRSIGDMRNGKIIDIFTAQHHSCVLTQLGSNKKVYCWGDNRFGQLGNGSSGAGNYSSVPVEVGGDLAGKDVTSIGGTGDVSCAIASGKIYCWGRNHMGQLGFGNPGDPPGFRATPVQINSGGYKRLPNNYFATKLATGGSRSQTMCTITTEKKAYCWGLARFGQMGIGPISGPHYSHATLVEGLENVTDISQDGYNWADNDYVSHTCAIALTTTPTGTSTDVYCWGGAGRGQSGSPGSGLFGAHFQPAKVGGLPGVPLRIEVGIAHSCALVDKGVGVKKEVYCWGDNKFGQLGKGNDLASKAIQKSSNPVLVHSGDDGLPESEDVVDIAAGANRGCAIMTNKRSYCWGLNENGQIGDGTSGSENNRFSPTESLFLRPVQNRYIY
jgi:regulator of chromosome condensation RCC1